jgi:hypothetical protein
MPGKRIGHDHEPVGLAGTGDRQAHVHQLQAGAVAQRPEVAGRKGRTGQALRVLAGLAHLHHRLGPVHGAEQVTDEHAVARADQAQARVTPFQADHLAVPLQHLGRAAEP